LKEICLKYLKNIVDLDFVSHLGYKIGMSKSNAAKKSAMIRARTTVKLKNQAEKVFHQLGLSSTEAINMFYAQVCLRHGMPFLVEIPNEQTLKVMEKTERGMDLVHFDNATELFKKLGI
jgi:DNA-damage-inducible protein J